ncbi:hypothetical protein SVIOM342S_04368 [Streptomyces violaceorubidus]
MLDSATGGTDWASPNRAAGYCGRAHVFEPVLVAVSSRWLIGRGAFAAVIRTSDAEHLPGRSESEPSEVSEVFEPPVPDPAFDPDPTPEPEPDAESDALSFPAEPFEPFEPFEPVEPRLTGVALPRRPPAGRCSPPPVRRWRIRAPGSP